MPLMKHPKLKFTILKRMPNSCLKQKWCRWGQAGKEKGFIIKQFHNVKQFVLLIDVAKLKIWIIIHYISGPVSSVLSDGKIQPWFIISIVVDNGCIFHFCFVKGWIITKTQYVPCPLQRMSQIIKSDQPRRQCAKFPKCSVLILQNKISIKL